MRQPLFCCQYLCEYVFLLVNLFLPTFVLSWFVFASQGLNKGSAHLPHICILLELFQHFLHPLGVYLYTTIHYVRIVCFHLRNKLVYVGLVPFSIFGAGVTFGLRL